jgi:hypothetical protein
MKELSAIIKDTNGYRFECWWNGTFDIREEVAAARKHCGVASPFDVLVGPSWQQNNLNALVTSGNSIDEARSMRQMECVHSYLLEHEWTRRQRD